MKMATAAAILGVTRQTIWRRMKKLGISWATSPAGRDLQTVDMFSGKTDQQINARRDQLILSQVAGYQRQKKTEGAA